MAIAILALGSAWLVMLALSVETSTASPAPRARGARPFEESWLPWVRHGLCVYALPLLAIHGAFTADSIDESTALGLALCVAAGSGTSGATLARMAGADAAQVRQGLLLSISASLLLIPAAVYVFSSAALAPRAAAVAAMTGLFAQLLPYALGHLLLRPRRGTWVRWLKGAADASVLILIVLVFVREAPLIWQRPAALLSVTALALLLVIGGRIAAREQAELALLALVRNLTGALAVASVLPATGNLMLTLSAFGLPMYAMALPWALYARRSIASRSRVGVKCPR